DLDVGSLAVVVDRRLDALDRVHLVEEPSGDLLVPDRELGVAVRRELRPLHVLAVVGHHRVQLGGRGVDVERPGPTVGEGLDLLGRERVGHGDLLQVRIHECALVPATGRRLAASSSCPGTSWWSTRSIRYGPGSSSASAIAGPTSSGDSTREAGTPMLRASSSKRISGDPRSNEPGNAWSANPRSSQYCCTFSFSSW